MTGDTTVALIGLGTIIASLLISLTVFAVLTARIERGYRRYSSSKAEALAQAVPQQRTGSEQAASAEPERLVSA